MEKRNILTLCMAACFSLGITSCSDNTEVSQESTIQVETSESDTSAVTEAAVTTEIQTETTVIQTITESETESVSETTEITEEEYEENTVDWKEIYDSEIKSKYNQYGDVVCYDLCDINKDGVPELFISAADYRLAGADVYTIYDSTLSLLGNFGTSGVVTVCVDKNVIHSSYCGESGYAGKIFEIVNGEAQVVLSHMDTRSQAKDKVYINDVEVTTDEYDAVMSEYESSTIKTFGRRFSAASDDIYSVDFE